MRMPSTWPRILCGNRGRTSLQSCATGRRAESPTTRRTDTSGATEVKAEYPRPRIGHFAAPRQTRPQSERTPTGLGWETTTVASRHAHGAKRVISLSQWTSSTVVPSLAEDDQTPQEEVADSRRLSIRCKILRVVAAAATPASRDARTRGCTCPVRENRAGGGWEVSDDEALKCFWIDEQCVVHRDALSKP